MTRTAFLFVVLMLALHAFCMAEDTYRLEVGDVLELSVYGDPKTNKTVSVSQTGTIAYLFIQAMPAAGKTIEELRQDLVEELKTYYLDPHLSINAIDFSGSFYTLLGEVSTPGRKPILGSATVLSAICESGGFVSRIFRNQTTDLVDLDHSFLSRNGRYVPVDFSSLVLDGDMSTNLPLEDGDFIYIARINFNKVWVVGEVSNPTTINYFGRTTLAQAVSQAGGLKKEASSRAIVIRGSLARPVAYYIDLNRIQKGCACDFMLEKGDIVYIPPFRFHRLKEVIQEGVQSFVSIVGSFGGNNAFLEMTPAAKGSNITPPTPVLNP